MQTTPVTNANYEQNKLQYIGYEEIVKLAIQEAKKSYFIRNFDIYLSTIKKTWREINDTLVEIEIKINVIF